mmetsp:Transcript_28570/g.77062  ORF Transcript_28570/g.77062 Transcript_28570/m.77062 type:complete len:431 (-) Transcript_28570:4002-5294(-)
MGGDPCRMPIFFAFVTRLCGQQLHPAHALCKVLSHEAQQAALAHTFGPTHHQHRVGNLRFFLQRHLWTQRQRQKHPAGLRAVHEQGCVPRHCCSVSTPEHLGGKHCRKFRGVVCQQQAVCVPGCFFDVHPKEAAIVLPQPQELAALIPEGVHDLVLVFLKLMALHNVQVTHLRLQGQEMSGLLDHSVRHLLLPSIDAQRDILVNCSEGSLVLVPQVQSVQHIFLTIIVSRLESGHSILINKALARDWCDSWAQSIIPTHMIHLVCQGVYAAVAGAVNEHRIFSCQEHDLVRLDAHALQRSGLSCSVREAVQQPAVGDAVLLLQALAEHFQQKPVLHSLALLDEHLGFQSQGRALCHLLVQQVSHNNVRQCEAGSQLRTHGGFADPRRSQHHDCQGVLAVATHAGVPQTTAIAVHEVCRDHGGEMLVHGLS